MAKHLITVCVVCLLCAEHLPCKEHINNNDIDIYPDIFNFKDSNHRVKRHSDHNHDFEDKYNVNINSKTYTNKIFERFSSNKDDHEINLSDFEEMLKRLSLYSLYSEKDQQCVSTLDLLHHTSSEPDRFIINNKNTSKSSTNLNNYNKSLIYLNHEDFYTVCPILLYHVAGNTSSEKSACIKKETLHSSHVGDHKHEENHRGYVWLYSSISIFGVSLCGLLGVAVIPCMEKHFYNQLLQFLVSLAVGTLTGDALLHLLPHSFLASSGENPHEKMIMKGLVAVLGVIFFFFTERVLIMLADCRKNRQKKEKPCSRVRVMRNSTVLPDVNSEKICKNKYSSYPYCYDEIAMETRDDIHHHHGKNNCEKTGTTTTTTSTVPSLLNQSLNEKQQKNNFIPYRNHDHGDNNETAQSLLSFNYTMNDNFTPDGSNPSKDIQTDNNTISTNFDDGSVTSLKEKNIKEENFTVILREHESKHHGHSHTHGHVHSPPANLSAVAWMVVMGDGLHNFTDGMTIGAAFSNSIAGGFSTAIAVFCHELPHELGDFAVLLKAGMSAKQAVYYNILSSVLSFFGMILGVLIGEQEEASAWVFACAAGLFIYIALVDMMPEITASHKDADVGIALCFLQVMGMLLGLGIMLVIALYEDDLKVVFVNNNSDYGH